MRWKSIPKAFKRRLLVRGNRLKVLRVLIIDLWPLSTLSYKFGGFHIPLKGFYLIPVYLPTFHYSMKAVYSKKCVQKILLKGFSFIKIQYKKELKKKQNNFWNQIFLLWLFHGNVLFEWVCLRDHNTKRQCRNFNERNKAFDVFCGIKNDFYEKIFSRELKKRKLEVLFGNLRYLTYIFFEVPSKSANLYCWM